MVVLIVGAGPAGLAAAAALGERGVPARVVDRAGVAGGAYREINENMTLATPTALNSLPGLRLAAGEYTTVREYREYLSRYAAHHRIVVQTGDVERIERRDAGFVATVSGRTVHATAVVVATGMWNAPVMPQVPGPNGVPVVHARDWGRAAPEETAATGPSPGRVLIIGGGMSGVEIAEEIAGSGQPVSISVRRPIALIPRALFGVDLHHYLGPLERLPLFLARRRCDHAPTPPAIDHAFSSLRAAGLIQVRPPVLRRDGQRIHFHDGGVLDVDLVVAATGYRYATPFLPPEVARSPAGHLEARRGESVSWRNLFVVGHPCAFGLASQFLRGIAHDAPRIADRIADRLRR